MDEYRAWSSQAQSDLEAATRVLDRTRESTFCQSIAKSQQAVEKSVKGLVAALNHHGIAYREIGKGHGVEPYVNFLVRQFLSRNHKDIRWRIQSVFGGATRNEIRALELLVPRRPQPGRLPPRNTEYPYQDEAGSAWRAPSEPRSFTLEEVDRFYRLAHHVTGNVLRMMEFMDRAAG